MNKGGDTNDTGSLKPSHSVLGVTDKRATHRAGQEVFKYQQRGGENVSKYPAIEGLISYAAKKYLNSRGGGFDVKVVNQDGEWFVIAEPKDDNGETLQFSVNEASGPGTYSGLSFEEL